MCLRFHVSVSVYMPYSFSCWYIIDVCFMICLFACGCSMCVYLHLLVLSLHMVFMYVCVSCFNTYTNTYNHFSLFHFHMWVFMFLCIYISNVYFIMCVFACEWVRMPEIALSLKATLPIELWEREPLTRGQNSTRFQAPLPRVPSCRSRCLDERWNGSWLGCISFGWTGLHGSGSVMV